MKISVKDAAYICGAEKYPWFLKLAEWEIQETHLGHRLNGYFSPTIKSICSPLVVVYAFIFKITHRRSVTPVLNMAVNILDTPIHLMMDLGRASGCYFRMEEVASRIYHKKR